MSDNLLKYKIAIGLIPGIGCVLAKKIIAYVGDIEGIFKEKKANLLKIPDIGEVLANNIVKQNVLGKAEEEVNFIEKYNLNHCFFLDNNYPERLKNCEDSPILLFYKGNTSLNHARMLSFVGTRNATSYGKDLCSKFIETFAAFDKDIIIVSGLAYGIDIYAHKAALHNNMKTFAVLGHGLDQIYPSTHKAVAKEITQNGNLITEFLSSSTFDKTNFVKRNRIVAGMTDATIVIESAAKGGALITADIANSYNRDVFAVPGRSSDKYSEGCNFLIKTNKAALVDSAEDIIYLLGWNTTKSKKPIQKELFVDLTDEEKTIYNYLKGENNLNIDAMCRKLDIPVSKASSILLGMEFKGLVKSLPGKIYTIN